MAKIIYFPNPLRDDVIVKKNYDSPIGVGKVIEDINAKGVNLVISINGQVPEKINENTKFKANDFVRITPEAAGNAESSGQAQKVVGTLAVLAGAAVSAFGGPGGLAIGLSLAGGVLRSNGLRLLNSRPGVNTSEQTERAESPSYSLGASGNAFRPNGVLPLPMGNHRMYPDFSSQPYVRYVNREENFEVKNIFRWLPTGNILMDADNSDFFNGTFNFGGTVYTVRYWRPSGLATYWTASTSDTWIRRTEGDLTSHDSFAAASAGIPDMSNDTTVSPAPDEFPDIVYPTYMYVSDPSAPVSLRYYYVEIENAQRFGLSAFKKSFGGNPASSYNLSNDVYEYTEGHDISFFRREQQLKQIMNFGYGDLDISDRRIGQTKFSEFRFAQFYSVIQGQTNWPMPTLPDETTVNDEINSYKEFNSVEGNVDVVDGGELVNNEDTFYPDNYIIRESPENTYAIEVNVEGRLFGQDNINQAFVTAGSTSGESSSGFVELRRELQIQYRLVGSATWLTIIGNISFSPQVDSQGFTTISGMDYEYPFRETYITFDNLLTPGKYEVRIAKVSPDERFSNNVCSLSVTSISFYQTEIAENFVAQNREGIKIRSSSQLNGKLDRYSGYIQAKCWKNDGSGNFTWDFTSNPADWYLYYARGGFENPTADGSLAYPYSPTVGWVNSADHPDNGFHIWGAGVGDDKIDFNSINEWWTFCDTNNLTFNAVLDDSQNCFEVLNRIAIVGRGSISHGSGKLGVVYEDPNQPAVAMFGMGNIIRDSFSISYNTENLPDKVTIRFVNPDNDWTLQSVEAVAPFTTNVNNVQTITMWGITSKEQAQREANLIAARSFYNRRLITWDTDIEGLICQRGDVVYLSHDVTQWSWSARICDAVIDLGNVTLIKCDQEIPSTVSNINVRLPDNTFLPLSVTISGENININDPWPAEQFAEFYGKEENLLSTFTGTNEVDFMFFAGIEATPGKKVRITNMEFSEEKVSITAIDEEDAYYAREYIDINPAPDQIPEDYTRPIAKAYNLGFKLLGEGKADLFWETDGTDAVEMSVSINGSPSMPFISSSGATIFGGKATIEYVAGDEVVVTVTPIVTGTPYASITDSVTLVLE